jgi:tol-pal system protein YbgF
MAQPTTPQTIATATPPAAAIAPQGQAAGSSLLKSDEPGVLGTLTQSDLQRLQTKSQQATGTSARSATALPAAPKPPTTPSATASEASEPALPVGSPQERYRYAFQFLKKQQFAKAERSFKAFLEEHPDDPLAGNVSYWLGETYYVRGDYLNAAVTFAQGYQTYPASPKTADNLLKLAMTLARLKRSEDACFAFDRLREQFPNASSNIKRRAHLEETRLKCPA